MTFFYRDKSGAGAPLGTFLKGLKIYQGKHLRAVLE